MILLTAFALILLSAVCVGGVSGADVWDGTADTTWSGSGTAANPYLITSAEELAGLAQKVNGGESFSGKYFYLTVDIDLSGKLWNPIGYAKVSKIQSDSVSISSYDRPFSGTFSGNGHSIFNLCIKSGGASTVGLFGYVAGGRIEHLHLDGDIRDGQVIGGVTVNLPEGVEKTSCYFSIQKDDVQGSLVGLLHAGSVSECSVLGNGVGVTAANEGNNNFVIAGLVGTILDKNNKTISSNAVNDYLSACSVIVLKTDYGKTWGLLVGRPVLGDVVNSGGSGGTADSSISAVYTVKIYEMKSDGTYNTVANPTSTQTYVGLIGSTVTAHYTLPEGYTLDESKPNPSGTVKADGSLVLSVYLRNRYTLTFVSDGNTIQSSQKQYGSSITVIPVPEKPGYTYSWDTTVPKTMPAKDLVITAIWTKIDPIFMIQIPDSIPLSSTTEAGSAEILVDVDQLSKIGKISITVNSTNNFALVLENHPDITLPYQLYAGNPATLMGQDGVVGIFTRVGSVSIPLLAQVTGTPQYSGSYQDSLIFTVTYSETNG